MESFLTTVVMSPESPKMSDTSSMMMGDESRDSGYGSPDLVLKTFSLDTPESTPPPRPQRRNFHIGQVKRSLIFKRSRDEPEHVDDSPLLKRRKIPVIRQTRQDAEKTLDEVKKAVDMMENDRGLVGDGTETHKLPTIPGRHKDLKSVTSQTVKQLLAGVYDDVITDYQIVDCRYPYEYQGGHIKDAVNLHTEGQISDFIKNQRTCPRTVLIFHCEFSSERGPKLMRHLRSEDRKMNIDRYPFLFCPEVYLLDGGYKAFYEQHQDQCEPRSYLPMLHEDYSTQLRYFRSSKSQTDKGRKRAIRRRHLVESSPCSFAL